MSTAKSKKTKWFGMKVTPAQKKQIQKLAARKGVSQSQAVLDLVNKEMTEESVKVKAKPGSFLDSIEHLAGSIEGPGDLSTNPKYMEDYGK